MCASVPFLVRPAGRVGDGASSSLQIIHKEGVLLTWRRLREAVGEGVPCISFRTSAHWRVIHDIALGPCTARSRARVATPLPHASSVASTFRVNAAFGSAVGRYAHVIRQARTGRGTSNISALRVWSARRRHTRVLDHGGNRTRRRRRCKKRRNPT